MVAAQPQYAYSTQRPFHAPPAGAVARMFHLELLASYPHAGCLLGLEKDDSSQPRDSPGEPVSGEDGTEWRELQVRRVPCKVTESADLALETILPGYWVVLSLQARSLAASGRVNSDEVTGDFEYSTIFEGTAVPAAIPARAVGSASAFHCDPISLRRALFLLKAVAPRAAARAHSLTRKF